MSDALAALAAAVAAAPASAPLRVHYASLLLAAGRPVEALEQASAGLRIDPADGEALRLVQEAAASAAAASRPGDAAPGHAPGDPGHAPGDPAPSDHPAPSGDRAPSDHPALSDDPGQGAPAGPGSPASGIDWDRLEDELDVRVPPPFVEEPAVAPAPADPGSTPPQEGADPAPGGGQPFLVPARDDAPDDGSGLLEVSRETVTLADVGGREPV